MIGYDIDDSLDIFRFQSLDHLVEIFQSSDTTINISVIRNVVFSNGTSVTASREKLKRTTHIPHLSSHSCRMD